MTTKTARDAQRRARLQEAARSRAAKERRRQVLVVGAAVAAVAALVAVFAVVAATGGGGGSSTPQTRPPASAALVAQVTGVPAATLDAVGAGTVKAAPRQIAEQPLLSNGKPLVLYVGAEYCPYCAAERWALIQALSRFGTWAGLTTIRSPLNDVHPNTATFSFHGATYTSDYVAFDGRELYTNVAKGRGYTPLDKLTGEQGRLFNRYGGGFPFVDLGGRSVQAGVSFDSGVLDGLEWEQIGAAMADPSSPVARGVDGAANVFTATICKQTGGNPGNVCTAPGVAKAAQLGG